MELFSRNGDHGCVLRGPDDLVFDDAGGFWFIDHGKTRLRERDVTGVFYVRADGSNFREVIFPSENSNAVGLSPDGRRLYAAETFTWRLCAFDLTSPGEVDLVRGLGGPSVSLYRPGGYKFFDSLAIEENGNICVATIGECEASVVSPEGELVEFVPTDDPFTTNIAFGGADMRDAYVTLSGTGRLAKRRWPRPGLRLAHR